MVQTIRSNYKLFRKKVACVGMDGVPKITKGKAKPILVRKILALQLKRSARKSCELYLAQVETKTHLAWKKDLETIPITKEFQDFFLEEIPRLPPSWDIYFTINLVPGVVPVSRAPHCMSTLELLELKMKLQ